MYTEIKCVDGWWNVNEEPNGSSRQFPTQSEAIQYAFGVDQHSAGASDTQFPATTPDAGVPVGWTANLRDNVKGVCGQN